MKTYRNKRLLSVLSGISLSLSMLLVTEEASAFALTLDRRTDGTVTPLLWSDQFLRRNADGSLFRDQNNRLILDLGVAGINLLDGEPGALGRALNTWRNLSPPQTPNREPSANLGPMQAGDVSKRVGGDRLDLESIFLHELGHAMGLTHPNLADRTPDQGNNRRFTASLRGQEPTESVPSYHLNTGTVAAPGTADDVRNGDASLNFVAATNNPFVESNGPFLLDGPYNAPLQGYSQAPTREVARTLGYQNLEAVMVQGVEADERQRALAWDDVLGVRFLQLGADQAANTLDDFLFNFILLGPGDPGFANAAIQVRNVSSRDVGATALRFPRGGNIRNVVTEFDRKMDDTPVSWSDIWLDGPPSSNGSHVAGVNIFVVQDIPEPNILSLLAVAAVAGLRITSRRDFSRPGF